MKVLSIYTFIFISIFGCGSKEDTSSLVSGIVNNTQQEEALSGPAPLSILVPLDSTYSVNSTLDFQVTFDSNIFVSGTPCLDLNIGGTARQACYVSGHGSYSLFFRYTVQAGENDNDGISVNSLINLEGGSVKNISAEDAQLNFGQLLPSTDSITVNTSISGPDKVLSVNQTNLSEDRTEVSFTWSAPNDNGNPISFYSVRYKKDSDSQFAYLSPNPTGTSTSIDSLNIESIYEIQVAAYNGVMGAYSSTLNVSTHYNPASLGALIWYEARDINNDGVSIADGTSVTTFFDKSGNSNNATKLAAGTAATIETVDGKRVIRMGECGYRSIQSLGETANTDVEIYIVAKTRQVTNSFAFVNENQGNNDRFGSHFPWGNGNAYVDLTMGNRMYGAWGGNTTDFFAWTFRGSTTQGKALERNGVEILNAGNRTLTPALKKWTIGSDYAGNGTYWKADMQAIFVFDKVLTASQRTDFFTYLEDEYGVEMQ